mgnify:FL=1
MSKETFEMGVTYANKHNGRTIVIDQRHIGDTGIILWRGVDVETKIKNWFHNNDRSYWIRLGANPKIMVKDISDGYTTVIYDKSRGEEE